MFRCRRTVIFWQKTLLLLPGFCIFATTKTKKNMSADHTLRKILCLLILSLAGLAPVRAQSTLYQQYIERYKEKAIEEMERHGVPASITLAQGLLESGAGTSMLATRANNHFGIKTGGTWTGPYVTKDDDHKDERFRKYASAEQSFEDHSLFLRNRARYAFLFDLDQTDYKAWARGLKAAGYATNPEYANKLINIIELYGLHQYDLPRRGGAAAGGQKQPRSHHDAAPSTVQATPPNLQVRRCNDRYYVLARQGDTYRSLSRTLKIRESKLRKYNEVDHFYQLRAGDVVYLEKKATRVAPELRGKWHIIQAGESVHAISQKYGVQLRTLYRTNRLSPDYVPQVADRIQLR